MRPPTLDQRLHPTVFAASFEPLGDNLPIRDDNGSEPSCGTAAPGDRAGGVGELGPHERGFGGSAPKARTPACASRTRP